jgi:hypothetical protein
MCIAVIAISSVFRLFLKNMIIPNGRAKYLRQPALQLCLHRRPFIINNAIHDRITECAVGTNALFAKDAFVGGADAEYGGAAALISFIGLKLYPHGLQGFEAVCEQQQLALTVEARAPTGGVIPGPPYLQFAVFGKYVVEQGAAYDLVLCLINNGEGILFAGAALQHCAAQVLQQALTVGAIDGDVLPYARVLRNIGELGKVGALQRD